MRQRSCCRGQGSSDSVIKRRIKEEPSFVEWDCAVCNQSGGQRFFSEIAMQGEGGNSSHTDDEIVNTAVAKGTS